MTSSSQSSALGADNILDIMRRSLSQDSSSQSTSIVKSPYSAIALLCHSSMLAAGFRLVGLGEDHRIEAESDGSTVQPLPSEWDASTSSSYAFRYKHSRSSMEYLVKVNRLGSKAIIFGIALGDDKTAQFEIKVQDYISDGSLGASTDTSSDEALKTYLQNVFISQGRITDLAKLFNSSIIQKLAPGIHKQGYEEETTTETNTSTRREQPLRPERAPDRDPLRDDPPQPARPYPFDDPLAIPRPGRTGPVPDFQPPGFEDEFEMNQPPRGYNPAGRTPFGRIGEQDLYPPGLGPHDPLRIGPGGRAGGGGMHPTFDDPIFGGQQGGSGFDPRAPPGARYDPPGPGFGPPRGSGGGTRFPGGPRGGPPNPFGGFGSGDFI